MDNIMCYCCGKELPEGSLKYVVEVKSFADFDGFLEDYSGDAESAMVELLEEAEYADQQTLEEDVYHEMMFILCKNCRDKFYKSPFGSLAQIQLDKDIKGSVH